MKVVSTSPSFAKYSNEPIEYLEKYGIELMHLPADITEEAFIAAAQDADAAIVAFNQITEQVLAQAPRLKLVCKHGVGVDNIDLKAAKERQVWVTNVPNANKHAVADFAFALMLSLARQIPLANELTKKGEWPRIFGTDVYGRTVGIIGLGSIGKEVARRAGGFDMNILAYDPYPDHAFAERHGVSFVTLDELLERSDFVTLHIALTEQTQHFIGKDQLKRMKESAYLINAARGGIVEEEALHEALTEGIIAGAALDVFEQEPLKEHPLFALPNCIALPHIAGYTSGAVNALGMTCVRNIVNVLVNGQRPEHVMNGL
ncbi:phosphoglycerate dehydrogenase [Paenibacillus doosanensis]|uniref:D-3-phosphoglycerate dehydrogenase n=1 Tax=Paenibacillus konkukensis TaxID=2020716 RepID=A0ABY4RUE7_9BACL|nr:MULTISPECIES: phosphoglycerate dehydrogenase [Paenibacillus]MCS7463676.1 phosphoglycerate dehydrogenase [Paenibacillus doosanensis]UQZ85833.1 D-3-phosphoglycerate dehydrogenase [Paenibacillus konkukensis]